SAVVSAIGRLDHDRLLVLATSRPPVRPEWSRLLYDEDRCQRISLASFTAEEVAALARQCGVELSGRQAPRALRRTAGRPAWVRTLLSELSVSDLTAPDGDLPAPRSLASAVAARISELSPPARQLAAALAVANQRLALATVGRIA